MKPVLTLAMLCYFALALTTSVHAQQADTPTPPRFPPPQIALQVRTSCRCGTCWSISTERSVSPHRDRG